jgi:RimJ/RimL family protein N-acetyltransferase
MLAQTLGVLWGPPSARFPRRMTDGVVTLRSARYIDLPRLYPLVQTDVLRRANGADHQGTPSFWAFCVWMRTTFPLAYVIEHSHRVIGVVGLSKLTLGQHLWVSMAIFQATDRHQGYGQRALALLLASLAQSQVVEAVYADVLKTNTPSRRLCAHLGFVPVGADTTRLRLVKLLRERPG